MQLISHDQRDREVEVLRERISKLTAAILRISETLDLPTVLLEVVKSARALTGARYGAIATVDESGVAQDFVTSGISADEHRRIVEWPEGPRLFEHFRDLSGPLRLADVGAFVRSLGFSPNLLPQGTFWGTAMRHREVHVGNFYLMEKAGGEEFTGEDEEVLLLFASQAATAIANARVYRDEQRARSDLEALIETSPVGVAVFYPKAGRVTSYNREAARIVESLRTPGQSMDELAEAIICRRGDGREIAFDQFPLAATLRNTETVRAEEVVLSVPDGRSVTTLINVTPVDSAEGVVESVVVTMQDLAPLQDVERARSGFLSMVSHELRTPLAAIRGSTVSVLEDPRRSDATEMIQFFRIIDEQAARMTGLISDLLDMGRIETGALAVSPEPSDVAALVDQARSTFLASHGRHSLRIDLEPDLPRLMADQGRILQVFNNLFINAARHAPESSPIRVAAVRNGTYVDISVSDEGQGIPPERLPHLFRKYPLDGTRAIGTGVGLAICRGIVEAHGGRIRAESAGIGRGARFAFMIPVADELDARDIAAPNQQATLTDARQPARILVVDDDPQTLGYVRDLLADAGYSPQITGDAGDLPRIIGAEKPALVLLDLVLPGADGIALMQSVPELADVPVIFISGYGRDETIARALEAGADDYVVKPFSPTELLARVRAALRRRAEPEAFRLGDLAIDYEHRHVKLAGSVVRLTPTEYDLLRELSGRAGRVVTYQELLRRVWRAANGGDPRVVRAAVKQLRKKLGDDVASPSYIVNERGVGYRMPRPGDAEDP